jgi:uncharacterized membrane protein YeaQ/YmgE (transglycosylase-associated protein family)
LLCCGFERSRARRVPAPIHRHPGRGTAREPTGSQEQQENAAVHIIWTIIIGFVAGIIAKFVHPGDNEPQGFVLTAILGIIGAFLATYIGQAIGWYRADESAGLIGAVVGAVIVLVIWGLITPRRSTTP